MMAKAGHTIARSLLEAYMGGDAGRRVHAGAIERGSVEAIRAVLWYADIRGFTAIADAAPGPVLIELLDEVFETLTAALRPRDGQVLKFLGDGMLAIFPCSEATQDATCARALAAATEAMTAIAALNEARRAAGKPIATVDLAQHLGEVLYGNVGAVDRRLHGNRACGQRGRAHRSLVRAIGAQLAAHRRVCGVNDGPQAARTAWPASPARRA